jgi:hypothetical protein
LADCTALIVKTPVTGDFMNSCEPNTGKTLRSDQIAVWLEANWHVRFAHSNLIIVWSQTPCANDEVLHKINRAELFGGYRFIGYEALACDAVQSTKSLDDKGVIENQTGAFVLRFAPEQAGDVIEVAIVSTHYNDEEYYRVTLASIPHDFRQAWVAFAHECYRLAYAYEPENRVVVIGGRHDSFVPTVDWADVILPPTLKTDIMDDVQSFFRKGAQVYNRLKLKPFRKLLLAGVPGTGKTMLCNALAKWALQEKYLVIYISSAQKAQGDEYGSTFTKIQYALEVASSSAVPTLIILEELDAYLHDNEKALILNVLDGSESSINPHGTLLISTTNYPEAIDERVLKRPGRLDRIFIIPEMKSEVDAGKMLQYYLGEYWRDEHHAVVPQLVGYAGAFIREMAIYALTQVAYDDLSHLSLELLQASFVGLKEQLATRDEFLKKREENSDNTESNAVAQPEAV